MGISAVSLLGGWFPAVLQIVAGVAVLLAIGWRDRRWRSSGALIVVVGAAFVTLFAAYPGAKLAGLTDPLPFRAWLWFGIAVATLIALAVGWRGAHWWRRGTAVLAIGLASLVCANQVNQFVGYYPTISSAVSNLSNAPLPGQTSIAGLPPRSTARMPSAGRLVAVDIPATYSGFKHRQELVYLPPIWFHGNHRPTLPAVELIGGERGGPGDWVRLGNAVTAADAYAWHHHGYAPILVFVDATERFDNDTECVDGPRGNSETHLAEDVPRFVSAAFGASRDPRHWAIAGFSMGGTCAIGLAVEHPSVFGHFVDISGDLTPNSGNPAQTLATLYGGSVAAEKAHDPLTVMHTHGPYHGLNGLFLTSAAELTHQREAAELSRAAAKAGIWSRVLVSPGTHVWQFAAPAFAAAFPWLAAQLAAPDKTKPA
jgi:S-formylglutathione hydrolase FrmB